MKKPNSAFCLFVFVYVLHSLFVFLVQSVCLYFPIVLSILDFVILHSIVFGITLHLHRRCHLLHPGSALLLGWSGCRLPAFGSIESALASCHIADVASSRKAHLAACTAVLTRVFHPLPPSRAIIQVLCGSHASPGVPGLLEPA